MKKCPECKRIYHDDTLNFCLGDSERLSGRILDVVRSSVSLRYELFRDTVRKEFEHAASG